MMTLRDIEEPVVMTTEEGARRVGVTHVRLFLNEQVIEKLFEQLEKNKPGRDIVDVPCVDLGCRIERGESSSGDSGGVHWMADLAAEQAEVRVFHDGFLLMAKHPVTGGVIFGVFATESGLRRSASRYAERLRQWRAEDLGARLESAMPEGDAPAPAKSSGLSPI